MSAGIGGRKLILEVRSLAEQIQWKDTPTYEDKVPRFDIEIVKPGKPIKAVFINPSIDGFDSHYDIEHSATVPCIGEERCTFCKRRVRIRWDGFVFVMSERRKLFILRISEGALHALRSKVDVKKLRGLWFIARRTGPHPNSPLAIDLGGDPEKRELPDPQIIRPTITRALGLDREKRMTVEFNEANGEVVFNDFTRQIPTE